MTIKKYAKKHELSLQKVKVMLPKLEGVKKCECCGRDSIPAEAIPIYIPDKNKYLPDAKKFCYIMDAISNKMRIDWELSSISKNDYQRCLKILIDNKYIVLDNLDNKDSLNPLDYTLDVKGIDWKQRQTKDKSKMIMEVLKTIQSMSDAFAEGAKVVNQLKN